MAYKNREEIVGKRFLSVSSSGKLKFSKISEWEWRSGIVRAASHKDPNHPELTVLVEFDDVDWKNREWLRLYQDNLFDLFLVEYTLVWTLRKETSQSAASKSLYWPSLTFKPLVDKAGLEDNRLQPVEYLVDKELGFVDYAEVLQYQEEDEDSKLASRNFSEVQKAIKQWTEYQDGQRILVTTPSVLTGYRVEVYRVEGTTQWYTAVIISYNDNTRELTLTDDTVLEEHNEDPCLVQMKLIGDGVVESILKGENIGITPRRRACANQQNAQVHYCTRTRSHYISSSLSSSSNPYLGRFATHTTSKKRTKQVTVTIHDDYETTSTSIVEKVPTHSLGPDTASRSHDRRRKATDSGDVSGGSYYRKHQGSNESRKRTSRQKRTSSSKDVDDTDSVEEEECIPESSQSSNIPVSVIAGQPKCTTAAQGNPDASTQPSATLCCSETESEAKTVDETLDELTIPCEGTSSEEKQSSNSEASPCKEQTTNGEQVSSSNKSLGEKIVTQKSETDSLIHIKTLSPNTGSVSVVLTPLPTSVVRKCCADSITFPLLSTDKNVENTLSYQENSCAIKTQEERSESSKEAKPIPPKVEPANDSDTKLSTSIVQEECQKSPKADQILVKSESAEVKCLNIVPEILKTETQYITSEIHKVEKVPNIAHEIQKIEDLSNIAPEIVKKEVPHFVPATPKVEKVEVSLPISNVLKEQGKTDVKPKICIIDKVKVSSSVNSNAFDLSSSSQVRDERKCDLIIQELNSSGSYSSQKPHIEIKREPEYTISSNQRHSVNESVDKTTSLSLAYYKSSTFKLNAESIPDREARIYDPNFKRESHHASFHHKSAHSSSNPYAPGMSFVDRAECRTTKEDSVSSHQSTSRASSAIDSRTSSPRSSVESSVKERNRSEEKKFSSSLHVNRNEPPRVYRDPVLVNSGPSVRSSDCFHQGLMHPAGISHSASAVFPRIAAALPQQSRSAGSGSGGSALPPPSLESYNLSSQLMPAAHVGSSSVAATSPGSHLDQHSAATVQPQAYRHLLSQHAMIPSHQYGNVGIDVMWQQKYNPNPWVIAQYEQMHMERERAIAQEREQRSRIERDRREDMERMDRLKAEREKVEKEREHQERERIQKEHQQKHERERDRDERERVARDVHHHFEESLRLAMQKQQQQQHLQKAMGFNLHLSKSQSSMNRSSPVSAQQSSTAHGQSMHVSDHEREKERMSGILDARMRHEQERWLASVQRNEHVAANQGQYPPGYPCIEPRSAVPSNKSEMFNMARLSPHSASNIGQHSSKSGIVPSPTGSNISLSQQKAETNFSLYGYQPFQHTYITHAQLKAREDTKALNNMPPNVAPGSKQAMIAHNAKQEKEIYERPSTPGSSRSCMPVGQGSLGKHHMKLMHHAQERSNHLYPPLVGSGGAFKPYEYSNSSPAPPAHQNSSSPTSSNRISTPHYHHVQQDQPENLVKSDHKVIHEQSASLHHSSQRYESSDSRHTVSTPPCSASMSYTPPYSISKSVSPASSSNYSFSLIQQGLVPNPLYIASTQANVNSPTASSTHDSKSSPGIESPPVVQQFSNSSSGITSGTPVCRANSICYTELQGQSSHGMPSGGHLLSTGNANQICPQEAHIQSRLHIKPSACRSPSPAHMYALSPGSSIQAGTPNSPHHSKSSMCTSPRNSISQNALQAQGFHRILVHSGPNTNSASPTQSTPDSHMVPLNLQAGYGTSKRKNSNEVNSVKRQKSDDHHFPPQLHPQASSNSPMQEEFMSNSSLTHSISSAKVPKVTKTDFSATPLHMPDAFLSSSASYMRNQSNSGVDSTVISSSYDTQPFIGKHSKLVKSAFGNTGSEGGDSQNKIPSNTNFVPSNMRQSSLYSGTQDNDESRTTVSPASSAGSAVMSSGSTNHTKLKKAWLQRHSENEDKKIPINACNAISQDKLSISAIDTEEKPNIVCPIISSSISTDTHHAITDVTLKTKEEVKVEPEVQEDVSTSSASEIEAEGEMKHMKRKLRVGRKHSSSSNKRQKAAAENVEDPLAKIEKKKATSEKDLALNCRRRSRKTKGRNIPEDVHKKKALKPPEKPSIAQLKKTGEAFLQDGPCCDVAPRLPKCRECRMTPNQRNKKMPNIFCRFYAYRKLRFGKSGTILSAGFSEPSDATDDDLKLWLPPIDNPPSDIEVETSKFLLTHVGDQFCDLVEMEKEAQTHHMCDNNTITWKRVVQGVREMCDVCETTLFNIHWVCHKCGFVVCIDCYKARKNELRKGEGSPTKDRDAYQWLFCSNKQLHEQEKLMLTQIIPSTVLWDVSKTLHEVRRKWNIPTYCNCSSKEGEQDNKHSTNGICKLMNAVAKCFSSEKESSPVNGVSDSPQHSKKTSKGTTINGVKQEDTVSGYSSESGGSPLSWLADVALNSSGKLKGGKKVSKLEETEDDKSSDNPCDKNDDVESDDDRNENFSTLRELLIRPMAKMSGKSTGSDSNPQKTLKSTLDEVISCVIEQRVRKSDKKCKEKQLLHFTRKHQTLRSGRELLPIRACMLTESSLLYPEIPHTWLGFGKILELTNPYHSGNLQMFQEQWKRGQPVIVADVGQGLDASLWNPESFLVDFGDVKNDFFNCSGGALIQNQPMRKFWEGFENHSKRMKDEDGSAMILKLKDWPPSEEFSEILPARYQDLIKVLPLPQYTHRDGMFNMASRLPDCFVRPDLGPRMYNSYGFSYTSSKGSSNLHLDVSDTVNVLAYVENIDETESVCEDIMKSLDESGCDSLMKKRTLENKKIGAIWHVYNARDADKIRDFLNKMSEEQGTKCDPHHDPIHNQEWYINEELRNRLFKEYGVEAYVIAQCLGDSIFIPAGSPHQVQNLKSCIKISEDFVSPESVGLSFFLTQEIRNVSCGLSSSEDKLQIKNIIYHAVKDALALLQSCDPEDPKS